MSNSKEDYMAQVEADYDLYVESQKQELRKEGAEELRIDILRQIESEMYRLWDPQSKFGMQVAKVIIERASI